MRSLRPDDLPSPDLSGSAGPVVGITYGTFDLFHVGHVRLFERIRRHCDRLIVAVSTDEFNALKGKRSVVPFADRVDMVRACRYVDEVIPETAWAQKEEDILRHGVGLFAMGGDWAGHFDHLQALCRVLYLPRTDGVSSSALKASIQGAIAASAFPAMADLSDPRRPVASRDAAPISP